MSALLQHNHTSSSFGVMENDLNGISARNDSSITRFSVTDIYQTEFHWSVMAATVAFLCQMFTIYWYRTTLTRIFRQNIWWAIVLLSFMLTGLPLTIIGTLEKHLYGSERFGDEDVLIVCGVMISVVAHAAFIIYRRRLEEPAVGVSVTVGISRRRSLNVEEHRAHDHITTVWADEQDILDYYNSSSLNYRSFWCCVYDDI